MALKFEMGVGTPEDGYTLPWKYRLDPSAKKPHVGDWVQLWVDDKYVDLVVVDVRVKEIHAKGTF